MRKEEEEKYLALFNEQCISKFLNMNSDKNKKQIIALLLKDIRKASKIIDSVCQHSRLLQKDLDLFDFRIKTAESLSSIYELQSELFDIEPTLTTDYLKPSLEPVNLDDSLERLFAVNSLEDSDNSLDRAIRQSTINEFRNYMSDRAVTKFAKAIESGKEYEFAEQWWNNQPKPFVPITKVYKQLKGDRLYIRFQAAKLLEREFGIHVWDDNDKKVIFEQVNSVLSKWIENDV